MILRLLFREFAAGDFESEMLSSALVGKNRSHLVTIQPKLIALTWEREVLSVPGEPKATLGRVLSLASVQPVAPDMLVCPPMVLTENVAQQTCLDLH